MSNLMLPLYKCHKEVRAGKITRIVRFENEVLLELENIGDITDVYVSNKDLENKPSICVGMYYVLYSDGYFSFSPAAQFEEGYSLVEGQ